MLSSRNISLMTILTLLLAHGIGDARAASPPASTTSVGQSQTIKIGHVGSLMGGKAHLCKDQENGARLAVEEIELRDGDIDFRLRGSQERVGGNRKDWTYDHRSPQRPELAGPHASRRTTYL
jgi:hypothetical protein